MRLPILWTRLDYVLDLPYWWAYQFSSLEYFKVRINIARNAGEMFYLEWPAQED